MRTLQENLQNIQFSMFQKINEEKKNQNRDENKVYILYDKSERSFNRDNSLACFNFKKYNNLNRKKYETKSEQIIERMLF